MTLTPKLEQSKFYLSKGTVNQWHGWNKTKKGQFSSVNGHAFLINNLMNYSIDLYLSGFKNRINLLIKKKRDEQFADFFFDVIIIIFNQKDFFSIFKLVLNVEEYTTKMKITNIHNLIIKFCCKVYSSYTKTERYLEKPSSLK